MASDPEISRAHSRIDQIEELLLRLVDANNTSAQSMNTLSSNVRIVADSVKQLSDKIDQFMDVMMRNNTNGRGKSPAA